MNYFATENIQDIGSSLMEKVTDYYNYLKSSKRLDLYRELYDAYYSGFCQGGKIRRTGQQGENVKFVVNEFRNILQHYEVLIAKDRPVWDCRAINTDHASLAQAELGNNLLDYYMRAKSIQEQTKLAKKYALVFGEGWTYAKWDIYSGKEVGAIDTNSVQKEGDVSVKTYTPFDVIRDYSRSDDFNDWIILRDFKNKYDVAAEYPNQKDSILSASTQENNRTFANSMYMNTFKNNDDLIPVYTFVHKKNTILPKGRIIEFVNDTTILTDDDLFYDEFPIYKVTSENQTDTNFGYTIAFDLLLIQKAMNVCDSSILSNIEAFAVQNILVPNDCNISKNEVTGGKNFIKYNPTSGKPEVLQLLKTSPEVYNYRQELSQRMELISGVNSVARGNPEGQLKASSGSALALVQSMAVQYASSFQEGYVRYLEGLGTCILKLLQKYITVPRAASIVGKSKRSFIKEFKGSDIDKVNRAVVDVGNPLMETLGGKDEIATQLLQAGFIRNPQQYLTFKKTGNLDVIDQYDTMQEMLIISENEKLLDGEEVSVIVTDLHKLHIEQHSGILSSAEARDNEGVTSSTLNHIQMHVEALRTTDPELLILLGQQPLMQGAIQPEQPGQEMPGNINKVSEPSSMPQMPTNPLTGTKGV